MPEIPASFATFLALLLLASLTPGVFPQNPDLQDKVLNLQGGKELLVKDQSGLLLPPDENAARWLNSFYQTKTRPPPPPSPSFIPENEKEHAQAILARTSGYLLESEKELIRNLKDYITDSASASTVFSSSWWRSLVYKTSTGGSTADTAAAVVSPLVLPSKGVENLEIPELVLKKLKLETLRDSARGNSDGSPSASPSLSSSSSCTEDDLLDDIDNTEDNENIQEKVNQEELMKSGTSKGRKRKNVLIAPVGDDWSASVWMDRPDAATFDIIALYFGDNENYSCPLCAQVVHAKGPKWRLYLDFTDSPSWSTVSSQYEYIMLPDDDLHMNTCAINKVFSTMRIYDLIMAQPSVCHTRNSATWRPDLHQNPQYLLRYTTFVEVMAPTYRMDLFHNVIRATFSKYWTYVGWGLDSVWPALLHYPNNKIAVIDAVCMRHVPTQGGLGSNGKKSSVYAPGLSPYTAKQEELIVFSAFNYSATTTQALGESFMSLRILGSVPNFYVLEAMAKTAGQMWPSVDFAGEYGVPKEAVKPLLSRDRDARRALAKLYSKINEKVNKEGVLQSASSAMRKIDVQRSRFLATSEGGEQVEKARVWVWLVPIAVLALATVKVLLLPTGSGGSGLFTGAGRAWRRVKSHDSP